MCGICGFLNQPGSPEIPPGKLQEMIDALAHRGPDDEGMHLDGLVGMGHRRLSIIDLEGGHQPLYSRTGTIVLVCNGEIYNYKKLQRELLEKGHQLQTQSDCEVIIHMWEEYGSKCVAYLRGMFAFMLYDYQRKILFGARDRYGQKPLYYSWDGGVFGFASEIKGLLPLPGLSRSLNIDALDQFLFYQFVPHPETIFKGVKQLPPGHCLLLQQGELQLKQYWKPPVCSPDNGTTDYYMDRIESALRDAVKSHLVSDVPVGIFLSGGIDSSLITAIATQLGASSLRTFSIGFSEKRYDERPFARTVSEQFGTRHFNFLFQPKDLSSTISRLAQIFDQPLADPAAMPLLFLSELTSHEVKAVLTGDGGDELFGGYGKYCQSQSWMAWENWTKRPFPKFMSSRQLARCTSDVLKIRKLLSRAALDTHPLQQCAYYKSFWEPWQRYQLYTNDLREQLSGEFQSVEENFNEYAYNESPLNQMLLLDQTHYLPDDLLLKTDYTTMAYGLEARAPFLDHILAASVAILPDHLKTSSHQTKIILRLLGEKLLPKQLTTRPKRGFGLPLKQWFRKELRSWVHHILLESSTTVPRYFRRPYVERILLEHSGGKRNHAKRIYSLVVFELWHRHYMT